MERIIPFLIIAFFVVVFLVSGVDLAFNIISYQERRRNLKHRRECRQCRIAYTKRLYARVGDEIPDEWKAVDYCPIGLETALL